MRELRKTKLFFLLLLLFVFVLGAIFFGLPDENTIAENEAVAQQKLEIEYVTIPGGEAAPRTVEGTSLPEYVKYIFNFAILIIGLIALGMLIYAGVRYLTSAGDPEKLKGARSQILAAFLGLIILLSSYLILTNINPQLVVFDLSGLKEITIKKPPAPLEIEQVTSSINVEIPPGPMIEGRIFSEERLEKIQETAQETLGIAIESAGEADENGELIGEGGLNHKLRDLAEECDCGVDDVKPCPCKGGCHIDCSGEGAQNCLALGGSVENCCACVSNKPPGNCRCPPCESDPCDEVREEIIATKAESQENIDEFLLLQEEANEERRELKIELDKLKKSLQLMELCPLMSLNSLSEFVSMKDYYEAHGWKLKKVKYWTYISDADLYPYLYAFDNERATTSAAFYCPVGGTRSAYIPESEIPAEEYERFAEEFEEYIGEAEHKVIISCPQLIPFGEIVDKVFPVAESLIEQIKILTEEQEEMVTTIDAIHQAINNCLPCRCTCSCFFGEGGACICEHPSEWYRLHCASGNPCPMGAIEALVKKSEEIRGEISATRDEIFRIIEEDVPPVLKALYRAKEFISPCVAEEMLEPHWLLLNCDRTMGAIGPEGKIIEEREAEEACEEFKECLCQEHEKCREEEDFKVLGDYDYKCEAITNCCIYNFFCCRARE
jgi:hypothetical protein